MMGQVSSKLRRAVNGYMHWCPGCKEMHRVPDSWKFNGNLEQPTFEPSVKITGKQTIVVDGKWTGGWVYGPDGKPLDYCCHYVMTNGTINFCPDCTHELSGQSIPLPDLPQGLRDTDVSN